MTFIRFLTMQLLRVLYQWRLVILGTLIAAPSLWYGFTTERAQRGAFEIAIVAIGCIAATATCMGLYDLCAAWLAYPTRSHTGLV